MTPRRLMATVIVGIALLAAFGYWTLGSRSAKIRNHLRGLLTAHQRAFSNSNGAVNRPLPARLLDQLLGRPRTTSQDLEIARKHEQALIELGYFTNLELRLTNQSVTRDFRSNFIWRIRHHFGTNSDNPWHVSPDHIWIMHSIPNASNEAGFYPTLPVKDVPEWQQIFKECIARAETNALSPPAMEPFPVK